MSRHRPVICCLLAGALGALVPSSLPAATVEGNVTIYELQEVAPSLAVATQAIVELNAPPETPIVWPRGVEPASTDLKVLASVLLQNGLVLTLDGAAATVRPFDGRDERDRARPRLLDVEATPVPPSDPAAIATGAVAVFGRLVDPPYRFDVVGDAVLVNGLEVFPSPGPQTPAPLATASDQEAHARLDAALSAYDADRIRIGTEAARARLAGGLAGVPGIAGHEWRGEALYLRRDDGLEEAFTFDPVREPAPLGPEERRAFLEEQAEIFAGLLRDGTVMLFGATYVLAADDIPASEFVARVSAVRRSSENDRLRIARIQALTHHRDAAADLVFAR